MPPALHPDHYLQYNGLKPKANQSLIMPLTAASSGPDLDSIASIPQAGLMCYPLVNDVPYPKLIAIHDHPHHINQVLSLPTNRTGILLSKPGNRWWFTAPELKLPLILPLVDAACIHQGIWSLPCQLDGSHYFRSSDYHVHCPAPNLESIPTSIAY